MKKKKIMWESRKRDAIYIDGKRIITREDNIEIVKVGKTDLDCDIFINDEKAGEIRLYHDNLSINISNKVFQSWFETSTCNTTKWDRYRIKEISEKIGKYVLGY